MRLVQDRETLRTACVPNEGVGDCQNCWIRLCRESEETAYRNWLGRSTYWSSYRSFFISSGSIVRLKLQLPIFLLSSPKYWWWIMFTSFSVSSGIPDRPTAPRNASLRTKRQQVARACSWCRTYRIKCRLDLRLSFFSWLISMTRRWQDPVSKLCQQRQNMFWEWKRREDILSRDKVRVPQIPQQNA